MLLRIREFAAMCILSLLFCLSADAAESPGEQPAAAQQALPNAVAQVAFQRGVISCATRINQVTNYLGFGAANSGVHLPWFPPQPDRGLLPIIMEVPAEKGTAYVSATVAPNQYNGCGATYDAVAYWPQSCNALIKDKFSNLKKAGAVEKEIQVLDAGPAAKIFLMPAGKSGCVSIKKEVVL